MLDIYMSYVKLKIHCSKLSGKVDKISIQNSSNFKRNVMNVFSFHAPASVSRAKIQYNY